MKILVLQFFSLTVSRIAVNITVMAKVISDEIMKLKIIVNGDEGQKQILDFERANKTLSLRIKELNDNQKQLSKQRKQDSAEYKANKLEIEKLTTAIADNKKKIDDQIKSMDNSRLTMEQLRKKAADLKLTMNHMNPNSKDLATVQKDLKAVETRILELRNGAKASGSTISNLADKFNHYSGIATALTATLAGVVLSVQGVIDYNNKLVDAQTKVGKATGMTNEEVKELTKSFSEFKTRTSSMDLLKIAEVGGKLGVPTSEIKAFTQEVDKAFVALGDNFSGGVEAVANKLGKLKGIFKETKDQNVADAINDIGSALNELDNQGTASAENVSDFALRVGTLPEKLKPTIAETLGLGAAFEESGLNAERASSGYNKFVRVAATETKKFAEVMRISEEEVKNLINQDPLQFFLKFAEGAKGLDATEISKMLEFLKLNDAEVISVIGAASESIDRFRESIETSNQALAEGTSLQTEFNRVNTNTAAIFEKVKKSIIGAFSSETVAKGLNWLITQFAKFIGAIEDADGSITKFRTLLVILIKLFTVATASLISYNLAIGTYNTLMTTAKERLLALTVMQKISNGLDSLRNGLLLAGNVLYGAGTWIVAQFTRNLNLQTEAQTRLNLVTRLNPWGAVLSVITAITAAYFLFREETKKIISQQETLNKIMEEGVKNAADELTTLDLLYKTATNENIERNKRLEAVKKLKEEFPDYFAKLNDEVIMNGKAEKSYLALRDAIISTARAEAGKELLKSKEKNRLQRDEKIQNEKDKILKENPNVKNNKYAKIDKNNPESLKALGEKGIALAIATDRFEQLELAEKLNKAADAKEDEFIINFINSQEKKGRKKEDTSGTGNPPYYIPGSTTSATTKKTDAEKAAEKAESDFQKLKNRMLAEIEKANQLEIDLQIEKQETLANLNKDWYQKELVEILAAEDRKIAELDKKRITEDEFKKLDEIIAKTKGDEQKKYKALKDQWIENNKELDGLKTLAAETTAYKIATLNQKAQQEAFKKQEEDLAKSIEQNKNLINKALAENTTVEQQKTFLASLGYSQESLNEIRDWEEGRKAIEKYYQQKSLEDQITYLREKIAQFNVLMATMPMSFTPEQLEQIEKYKQRINELLAEIEKLKKGEGSSGSGDFSSLSQFGKGSVDILGMTTDQWQTFLTNLESGKIGINEIGAAVAVMQNAYAQFYAFQQANMQAELRRYEVNSDRKKRRLEIELKTGKINQETYKKLLIEEEAKFDKKKAELEYKAAKRQRDMQIAQAIAGTALAIINAMQTKPFLPMGLIMAGIATGMGALQVATIMRQPLPEVPGAEDGYYPTIREQDGKMFNAKRRTLKSGLYSEPTVLVGEGNKTELVVDSRTLKRINPTIQQEYMREIQRVKGYEKGMIPSATSSGNDQMLIQAMQVMDEVRQELSVLRKYGVIARWENLYKTVEQIDDTREERQRIIEKNKR